jgi:hypothetical protein
MSLALFAVGSLLVLVLASGFSVYGVGQFEHAWGKGGSFQVLVVLSLGAAFMLTTAFGFSAALCRRFPAKRICTLLGAACAALFLALWMLLPFARGSSAQFWFVLVALPLIGALGPLLSWRRDG